MCGAASAADSDSRMPERHYVTITTAERLRTIPASGWRVQAAAEVLWDEHQIPFIRAATSDDVAYCIGVVHSHLRLGQMELLKRVSQGRLAEVGGPPLRRVDEAIRAIDLGRAVPAMTEKLEPETRRWLERYAEGVNDFRRLSGRVPPDLQTMGVDLREAWTIEDVLTIGRLASADVNWGKWIALFPLRHERGYDEYRRRLRRFSEAGTPAFGPGVPTPLDTLLGVAKTGSNAFVVSAGRSATGSALFAGDPHLGLALPNLWCIVAYRSPTDGAAGLTIPGLPFVLVGRNDRIAWGGTNMHSLSSVLYEVNGAADQRPARNEAIRTRWWKKARSRLRESSHGPVISDAKLFRTLADHPVALRWRGHDASDEAAAMLRLSRARSWDEFRSALGSWAAGGQNLLYADADGNIGQVLAVEMVAAAGHAAFEHVVSAEDDRFRWSAGAPSTILPAAFNPDQGFLVSANNTPTLLDPPLTAYGNTNDRVHRITEILTRKVSITTDDLRELQRDVYSASSHRCAEAIAEAARRAGNGVGAMLRAIAAWDGRYATDSTGAVAYQVALAHLLRRSYRDAYGAKIVKHLSRGPHVHEFVREDLEAGRISPGAIAGAVKSAAGAWRAGQTWGEVNRIPLDHPIGRVPVIGRRFRFGDIDTGGSSTTVHKANHPVTGRRNGVRFGACARHIFDMSDPDESHYVLLGGQDGWIGSENMLDQVAMWRRGDMIRVPLRERSQLDVAVARTELLPSTP